MMALPFRNPRWGPTLTTVAFVLSAAAAALLLRYAWHEPLAGVMMLVAIVTVVLGRLVSRRKAARVLRSGDVDRVLARWASSLERVPHPETMGPLMTATAFAAYGWVERAREVLRAAERGPAWEAALEHRLFLDTLLLTFEGQTDAAAERVSRLEQLPLPTAMPLLVGRVRMLRSALGALVRAFSHQGLVGDHRLLLTASDASPLVFWAMRYGAAILAVDAGDLVHALQLLETAPEWPQESYFRSFHRQILDEVGRKSAVDVPPGSGSRPPSARSQPPRPPAAEPEREPSPTQPQQSDSVSPSDSAVDEE